MLSFRIISHNIKKTTTSMKKITLAGIAMLFAISSCDDQTETAGYSLVDNADHFSIATDTFMVSTESYRVDADKLITRSDYTYLGRIKDPETGAYITCDYTTEFNLLEGEATKHFPAKDSIISKELNDNGELEIVADSCVINIMVESFQGDSLAAMKLQVCELDRPIEDKKVFYSSFDPEAEGYLRSDANAIKQKQVFSISDLTLSDSIRQLNRTGSYYEYVRVPLNGKYTDKQNNTYKNYGTYVMHQFYAHPEYFKNANTFMSHVCPGFYFKCIDGLGLMMEVVYTQLHIYYRYKYAGTEYTGIKTFTATPEVLQATHITNDTDVLDDLIKNEKGCTYIKTPAGIFTEVELPVEDIMMGRNHDGEHLNDTITMAKIVFNSLAAQSNGTAFTLAQPTNLLLVESDKLYTFFENNSLSNDSTSYLATYNSTYKNYTYNNIATLISNMWNKYWDKKTNSKRPNVPDNWNKVVLVPVQLSTQVSSSYYSSTTTVVGIANQMSLNSVRLVNSTNANYAPRISVIYSKNK